MNKLNTIALCALITPVLTLSAGSVQAHQSNAQDKDREQKSAQHEYTKKHENQSDTRTMAQHKNMQNTSLMQHRGFMSSAPVNGLQASNLLGAEVKTTNNEEVGTVNELIINESGQIVAVVVGVGGFLGMGEKDVAIGWNDVTRTGTNDDKELKIAMTRDQLSSAPKFEIKDSKETKY
ncbi:PRC-barrel domain-containing protein [Lacimicrobium sp. SS2-24]|uniref:PRC-barrel domain-containing protein n=1 Tax=Lacimicrobium sp. SS2-24 TaxID=2005569 RepID=UPI000B4BD811|nr:PRC-barrel domain-containing protein [Lacimicrobium sp. SS2-24]